MPRGRKPKVSKEESTVEKASVPESSSSKIQPPKKKTKKEQSEESTILEKGFIYFFYRPKIGETEVTGLEDIQRLLILLVPQGKEIKPIEDPVNQAIKKRLLFISKKQLPGIKEHQKYFGYVERVDNEISYISQKLDQKDYETPKTHKKRHLEGARPCGRGIYALVDYHKNTHLAYALELPENIGEVQEAFNISHEGSFVLMVKNPNVESGLGVWIDKERRAKYPEYLEKVFKGKRKAQVRFHSANPTELLDYQGTQVLFIGAAEDIVEELGKSGEEIQELKDIDMKHLTNDQLFSELHLDKKHHPGDALLDGTWV